MLPLRAQAQAPFAYTSRDVPVRSSEFYGGPGSPHLDQQPIISSASVANGGLDRTNSSVSVSATTPAPAVSPAARIHTAAEWLRSVREFAPDNRRADRRFFRCIVPCTAARAKENAAPETAGRPVSSSL